jgi:hypothetical protein
MKKDDLINEVVKLSSHKRPKISKFNSLIEEYVSSCVNIAQNEIMGILIDSLINNRTLEETIISVNNLIKNEKN